MGILQDATDLIGKVEYVFGASNIPGGKGDCSSFTQYVYNKNGVPLDRTTDMQVQQGTEVSKEALLPGDLVFFQGTYREGVSHVGIYAGKGKFIHNSGGGNGQTGVVVSNLNDDYFKEHYYTARRVATSEQIGAARVPGVGETSGGTVSGGSDFDRAPAAVIGNAFTSWGLDALGEIVLIVLVIVLLLLAVFFAFKAITANIAVPSVDDLGDIVNEMGVTE